MCNRRNNLRKNVRKSLHRWAMRRCEWCKGVFLGFSVLSKVESIECIGQYETAIAEMLNEEGFFCIGNPEGCEQFIGFEGFQLIFGDDTAWGKEGELIPLFVEMEQNFLVLIDVSDLQQSTFHSPVNVAVGHVADAPCSQSVYLAELPVSVQLSVVRPFYLACREEKAG